MEVRGADIGVDLGAQPFADSDRAEVVMDVVRDDRLAAGDQRADFLGREALVLGDLGHLRGDDPFTRGFNLGHVGSTSEQNAPGYDKVAEMRLESSL